MDTIISVAWLLQVIVLMMLLVNAVCIAVVGWALFTIISGIEVDPYLWQRIRFTYRHTLGSRRLGIWKTWKISYGIFHGSAMRLVEQSRKWTVV